MFKIMQTDLFCKLVTTRYWDSSVYIKRRLAMRDSGIVCDCGVLFTLSEDFLCSHLLGFFDPQNMRRKRNKEITFPTVE